MSPSDPKDGLNGGDESEFYDAEGWDPVEDWDWEPQDADVPNHQDKDVPNRHNGHQDGQPIAHSPDPTDALPVSVGAPGDGSRSPNGSHGQVDALPASDASSTSPTAGRGPLPPLSVIPPWWPTLSRSGALKVVLWTGMAAVTVMGTAALLYILKTRKTKTAASSTATLLSINSQVLDDEKLVYWCTDSRPGSDFSSWRKITDHDFGEGGKLRSITKP